MKVVKFLVIVLGPVAGLLYYMGLATYYIINEPAILPNHIEDQDLTTCRPLTKNTNRLWAIWTDGAENLPLFAKETIQMWRHMTGPDWEIRVIHTDHNKSDDSCFYSKYLSSDMIPKRFEELIPLHQADSVRLALIRVHGGVYMDISVMLLEPLEHIFWQDISLPEAHPNKRVLGGFYMWNVQKMYEVWMFAAQAEEPIVVAWHDLYLKLLNYEDNGYKTSLRHEQTKEPNPILKGWDAEGISDVLFYYYRVSWALTAVLAQRPDLSERFENKTKFIDALGIVYNIFENRGWNNKEFWVLPELKSIESLKNIHDYYPVLKFVSQGKLFPTNESHSWRDLHSNIGYMRLQVAKRGKKLELTNRDSYFVPLTDDTFLV
jgi:hypothetical protein